ncbi:MULTISPECIES: hypothetical protein [unclassified Kitasatospora]|uniref:hypothetical protein n=1 Tax=unclassified Kitasatospora TaxID=2633591 RepID=UPI0033F5508D
MTGEHDHEHECECGHDHEPLPPYRSYSWDGENGAVHLAFYPGEEEADEERKARFREMGARMLAELMAEQEADHTPLRPALTLIRGEDPS